MERNLLWTLSTNCNLNCEYCYYKQENRSSIRNDSVKKKINKIIKFAPDIIYLSGEPTIYSKTKKIIKHFADSKIRIVFTTNGVCFSRDWISFINSFNNIEGILFSLDGQNEFIHNYFRSEFTKVTENIRRFNLEKRSEIKTGITTVVSKINISYISEIVQFAELLGCNYIHFQPISGMPHYELSESETIFLVTQIKILKELYPCIQFSSTEYLEALLYFTSHNTFNIECPAGELFNFLSEKNELIKCPSPFLEDGCCTPSLNCINIIELVHSGFINRRETKYSDNYNSKTF